MKQPGTEPHADVPRRGLPRLQYDQNSEGSGHSDRRDQTLEARLRSLERSLDDARQQSRDQAATAAVLLELSASLAQLVSADLMAAKLAGAVPKVVDCDRAVVTLFDSATSVGRIAATCGYPPDLDESLRQTPLPPIFQIKSTAVLHQDPYSVAPIVRSNMATTGSVAAASAPIMVSGELIGWLTAAVTDRPERLDSPVVSERLRGLAGQAATAIGIARLVDQMRHQALHDDLTGLPNRSLILDRVNQMLRRARRELVTAAVLLVDLDGFKDVNDSLGHHVGDQLLREVAARLVTALRETNTIGRLGGDEFVVLVEGADGPGLVAERLLQVLREPFELEGRTGAPFSMTASIGIAIGARVGPSDLLRDADVALYAAKAAGKNRFVVFKPEMQTEVHHRLELEMDLRSALAADQLFLVYQPILSLASRTVIGVEALLRWRQPMRGVVEPDAFIPVLEKTGMIVDIGRWVLDASCRQAAVWQRLNPQLAMSVNVSARQLESDRFVDDVAAALLAHRIDPRSLVIEITETAIMRDADATARRLKAIKALGVRIAVDDFGTGYCSLGYLSHFPVDSLKIDRSFVSGCSHSAASRALINALVQLGKSLGLEMLAEGIEQEEQLRRLHRQHCDSGQGFLFAPPLDVPALEAFLRAQEPQPARVPAVPPGR